MIAKTLSERRSHEGRVGIVTQIGRLSMSIEEKLENGSKEQFRAFYNLIRNHTPNLTNQLHIMKLVSNDPERYDFGKINAVLRSPTARMVYQVSGAIPEEIYRHLTRDRREIRNFVAEEISGIEKRIELLLKEDKRELKAFKTEILPVLAERANRYNGYRKMQAALQGIYDMKRQFPGYSLVHFSEILRQHTSPDAGEQEEISQELRSKPLGELVISVAHAREEGMRIVSEDRLRFYGTLTRGRGLKTPPIGLVYSR